MVNGAKTLAPPQYPPTLYSLQCLPSTGLPDDDNLLYGIAVDLEMGMIDFEHTTKSLIHRLHSRIQLSTQEFRLSKPYLPEQMVILSVRHRLSHESNPT